MPIAIGRLITALGLAMVLVAAAPQRAPAQQRAEISQIDRVRVGKPPSPEDRRLPAPPAPALPEALAPLGAGLDAGLAAGIDAQARPPPPAAGSGMALATFLFATGLGLRQRPLE